MTVSLRPVNLNHCYFWIEYILYLIVNRQLSYELHVLKLRRNWFILFDQIGVYRTSNQIYSDSKIKKNANSLRLDIMCVLKYLSRRNEFRFSAVSPEIN